MSLDGGDPYRVCVRNLSEQADHHSLHTLFSKVATVDEIYIPGPTVTGIRRNFAIVKLACCSDASNQKRVTALNGSLWKGSRITVEPAQGYFRDRLEKERSLTNITSVNMCESQHIQNSLQAVDSVDGSDSADEDASSSKLRAFRFRRSSVNLKRAKAPSRFVRVSVQPTICTGDKQLIKAWRATDGKTIACGKKTVFDNTLLSHAIESFDAMDSDGLDQQNQNKEKLEEYQSRESRSDMEAVTNNERVGLHDLHGQEEAIGRSGTNTKVSVPEGIQNNSIIATAIGAALADEKSRKAKLDSPPTGRTHEKAVGGGVRRGFGTLLAPSTRTVAAPDAEAGGLHRGNKKQGMHTDADLVDCCVEAAGDNDDDDDAFEAVAKALLDDDSDAEELCLPAESLRDEALQAERRRALSMIDALLSGQSIPRAKDSCGKNAASASGSGSSAKQGAGGKAGQSSGSRGNTSTAQADVSEVIACIELNEEVISAPPRNSSMLGKKLGTLEGRVGGGESSDLGPTLPGLPLDGKEDLVLQNEGVRANLQQRGEGESREGTEEVISSAVPTSCDKKQEEEEEVLQTKDGFAHMNKLKNIFFREGGVWWGDDGTMKDAVSRGQAAQDAVFLAAEKYGIDIRGGGGSNSSSSSGGGGGGGSSGGNAGGAVGGSLLEQSKTNAADSKSILFGFFDSTEAGVVEYVGEGVAVPKNPFLSATTVVPDNASAGKVISGGANISATTGIVASDFDGAEHDGAEHDAGRPVKDTFTAADLVEVARRFSRDRPESELFERWRTGRDRLVLDYKRKQKDVRRKTAGNALASTRRFDRGSTHSHQQEEQQERVARKRSFNERGSVRRPDNNSKAAKRSR